MAARPRCSFCRRGRIRPERDVSRKSPLIRKEAVVGAVQPVPANPITPGGVCFCKSESGQTNSSLQNFAAILSQVGRRILAFSSRSELRNFGFKQYWNRSRMSSILLNNWLLFRTSDESPNNAEPFVDDFVDAEVPGIRCPLCNWRPKRSDAWVCCDCDRPEYFYGGCGTAWNTFETEGVCPTCLHQWQWTACFGCFMWSKHRDWYENE